MADKKLKKTTTVHEHPMHVPVSRKNPSGITTRHQHKRRVYDSTSSEELKVIFANYPKNKITYPSSGRLTDFKNSDAYGIAQITTTTLKILQDPDGEAKDFLFKDIRQKDLYDPEIATPLATRWLFRKKATATNRLGRSPTTEELILEYKGLLPSKTKFHDNALQKFKFVYEKLKKL